MSTPNKQTTRKPKPSIGWLMFLVTAVAAASFAWYTLSPAGASTRLMLGQIFSLESERITWYITRSAGIIAYLLLWLSTAWGLAIPSKIFDRFLHGTFTFDFHQFISLLSLGFLGLHVVVLLADRYVPFTWSQILVPFLSSYRPIWVGTGIIALYLLVLVTVTFYIRQRIGMKAFRYIHYTSLLAYLGATAHSLFSGTDTVLPIAQLMYAGTFLVIVFLTVYWLIIVWQGRLTSSRRESSGLSVSNYSRDFSG